MAHETFADELRAAVAGDKHTIYTELMLQAAELLAAKDAEIPQLLKELRTYILRAEKAEAKLAAAETFIKLCADGVFVNDPSLRGAARSLMEGKQA